MRNSLSLVVATLVALSLVGCKSGPKLTLKKESFTVPQGWMPFENSEQGIHIAAPSNWGIGTSTTSDTPSSALSDLAGSMGSNGEQASGQIAANAEKEAENEAKAEVKALEPKGIFVSAMDKNVRFIPGETRTYFNVKKITVGGNAQMDDVVKAINEELINEEPPTYVDLKIGKAARIHAHNVLKDGGETDHIAYGLVNGGDIYIVKFATEQQGYQLDQTASAIIDTLRIDK